MATGCIVLLKGSESLPKGLRACLGGLRGFQRDLWACQMGMRANQRDLRDCQEGLRAWGNGRMDLQKEFCLILQDFDPCWGRCPIKCPKASNGQQFPCLAT